MVEDPRLLELLEEALDSDSPAEEVCAQCPELLPELRRRLAQCQIMVGELAALFPGDAEVKEWTERQLDDSPSALPAIPGYELVSILGRGGMGVVYKARHLSLKRFVAIKMLLSGIHASASERARLKREAEALAKLTHPHIVQVHDVGEFESRPYFTMEFVEGGTLSEELEGEPQPANHCASILTSLAAAVEAAHQCGVLHRDLKPANVLLTVSGVPKISDFGLARQMEDTELITLTGARLGTPSYMAPEQASSRWGEVGRASDVYALGAILYEMMTGRPPFRGESAADTERQLLNEEVVPPSRLNARVPRDLETVCLKCLQKDSAGRYASAADLAEDLGRFQRGEPVAARRVGPLERSLKWVRRRPAVATAVAIAGLLALVLAAGGTWIISQRLATRRIVGADLEKAVTSQRKAQWKEASSALELAKLHLGELGPADLRRQFDQATQDSKLVERLDEIRGNGELLKYDRVDVEYIDAFRTAQIGGPGDAPEAVAARIRNSNVKYALIDALDDWVCFSRINEHWVSEVVRRADHDPNGWRDHMRDPTVWDNGPALAKAAIAAPFAAQPASFLLAMSNQLGGLGLTSASKIVLLTKVQEAHPDDFWINLTLGVQFAKQQNYPESFRYFQAAEAIRPNAGIVRNLFEGALATTGRWEEALQQSRDLVRLEPTNPIPRESLAVTLTRTEHYGEAVPRLEEVIRLEPAGVNTSAYYGLLGISLARVGREQEAVSALQKAIKLGPSSNEVLLELQGVLIRHGNWDQVESVWQDATKNDPAHHESWDGYAEYCIFRGHVEEYRKVRALLLDRFGKDDRPAICERVGRACLLLGDDSPDIARAAAMVDRAVHGKGQDAVTYHGNFMIAQALADYRQGNFKAALSDLEGDASRVLQPMPKLVAVMAHYRLGHQDTARKLLVESVQAFDWKHENATTHEAWMYHVLRREAEHLVFSNFDALLDGSAQPNDNDERFALLGACAFNDLRGRSAQLWTDALKAAPQLAKSRTEDIARALASAGTGQGSDAAKFTDQDRAQWRNSAVTFLSKRTDVLESILKSSNPQTALVQNDLLGLQRNPDLAGLREASALAHLPKAEQDQCTAVWTRISTLLDRSKQSK